MRRNWMMGAAGAALALVVVALLGASPALPNPRQGDCHGQTPRARLEAKLADLTLDAETRAKAEQLLTQARTEGKARWEELRDARRALRDLLAQDAPALEPVMAQADAVGALETEAHKAKLRTMLELRSLLSPAQWQELRSSLRQEHRERMEKS